VVRIQRDTQGKHNLGAVTYDSCVQYKNGKKAPAKICSTNIFLWRPLSTVNAGVQIVIPSLAALLRTPPGNVAGNLAPVRMARRHKLAQELLHTGTIVGAGRTIISARGRTIRLDS